MMFDEIVSIFRALEEERAEYVLVGGVAVGLHGFERATSDVDLFVRPTEENVERLRRALHSVFDDPSIDEISAADLAGEYPTIRYGPPEGDYLIDILGRLGTEIAFDDLEFETTTVGEVKGTLQGHVFARRFAPGDSPPRRQKPANLPFRGAISLRIVEALVAA